MCHPSSLTTLYTIFLKLLQNISLNVYLQITCHHLKEYMDVPDLQESHSSLVVLSPNPRVYILDLPLTGYVIFEPVP